MYLLIQLLLDYKKESFSIRFCLPQANFELISSLTKHYISPLYKGSKAEILYTCYITRDKVSFYWVLKYESTNKDERWKWKWKHGEIEADISDNIIAIWVCRHVHHHHGLFQAWHGPLGPCNIPSYSCNASHGSICSSFREVSYQWVQEYI